MMIYYNINNNIKTTTVTVDFARRNSRFLFSFLLFYNLLTALRSVSNTYSKLTRTQSCANHVQNIGRFSRATCRVSSGTKAQFSY